MKDSEPLQLTVGSHHLGLDVEFRWTGDRYQHAISLANGHHVTTLLESIEGCGDEAFPPSPPIQQITHHDIGSTGSVLLGIGMAGRNHWSLSVQANPDPVALEFDVACRVAGDGAIGRLTSSYQATSSILRGSDRDVVVQHTQSPICCRIDPHPARDTAGAEVEIDGTAARLEAIVGRVMEPTTIRWRYRVVPGRLGDVG